MALLTVGPAHGYQLKLDYERLLDASLNVGQVYTTLGRLARNGLVRKVASSDDRRKEYAVTAEGREQVRRWLFAVPEAAGQHREQTINRALLATVVPDVDLLDVVDAQRRALLDQLTALRDRQRDASDPRTQLMLDAQGLRLEATARWLDRLEARCDELHERTL